jgi:hypothetical protein
MNKYKCFVECIIHYNNNLMLRLSMAKGEKMSYAFFVLAASQPMMAVLRVLPHI